MCKNAALRGPRTTWSLKNKRFVGWRAACSRIGQEVTTMKKSTSFASLSLALAILGLVVSGCSAAPGDETEAPTVEDRGSVTPSELGPWTAQHTSPGLATLVADLGSGTGVAAAATSNVIGNEGNPVTAVRWPASAIKGSRVLTAGQPCSRVAALAGTQLTMAISLNGSYALCS